MPIDKSNSTFCIRPWSHSFIQSDGKIGVCCETTQKANTEFNLRTTSLVDWWKSDYVADMRTSFLANEKHRDCAVCWKSEALGIESLRQKTNKEVKILPSLGAKMLRLYNLPSTVPEYLEFSPANLCNLKCIMCREDFSSSIQIENRILNISKLSAIPDAGVEVTDHIKEWLKLSPKNLTLIGGEPLIMPQIKELLEWAVANNVTDDTEVTIITNGTKLSDYWLTLISKFKKVFVMVSVDGTGLVNDYVRYGSKWETIEESILKFNELKNIRLVVHTSLTNVNVMNLHELINWTTSHGVYHDIEIVTSPEIFHPCNLPQELIDIAVTRLTQVNNNISKDIINMLTTKKVGSSLWDDFKKETIMRNNVRNIKLGNYIPEFGNYF
jgi:sulfatase maturation enzyme AslB (radical SAM superfamily)